MSANRPAAIYSDHVALRQTEIGQTQSLDAFAVGRFEQQPRWKFGRPLSDVLPNSATSLGRLREKRPEFS